MTVIKERALTVEDAMSMIDDLVTVAKSGYRPISDSYPLPADMLVNTNPSSLTGQDSMPAGELFSLLARADSFHEVGGAVFSGDQSKIPAGFRTKLKENKQSRQKIIEDFRDKSEKVVKDHGDKLKKDRNASDSDALAEIDRLTKDAKKKDGQKIEEIGEEAKKAITGVDKGDSDRSEIIKEIVAATKAVLDAFTGIWATIVEFCKKVFEEIKKAIEAAIQWLKDRWEDVKRFFRDLGNKIFG